MTSRRRTSVLALAALLADLAGPALATAAPSASRAPRAAPCRTRQVLVAITGPENPGTVEFRRSVVQALSRFGCYRTVDPVESLEAGMAAGLARVDSGREALEQGRQAFLDMRIGAAIPLLERASDDFSNAFGHLPHSGPLVEALLTLGASMAVDGDEAGARKAFVGALHLRPDAMVRDVTTLPEAANAFKAAMGAVRANRTGSLLVDSDPPNAEVYLDGAFVGPAPYDQPAVAAGSHWVVLRKAGFERKSARVEVPDGGTASLLGEAAILAPSRRRPLYETAMAKLSKSGPDRGPKDGVEDLKALFLSDLLLVFDPGAGGLSASLWDLETMERVWVGKDAATTGLGRGAAEDLVARAIQANDARGKVQESGAATIQAKSGIASKWWFWTVLGVVVAGGVAGVLAWQLDKGSNAPDGLDQDGTGAVVVRF